MSSSQPGILADVPAHGLYLTYRLRPGAEAAKGLSRLAAEPVDKTRVVGLGPSLVASVGAKITGLTPLEVHAGPGASVPSTPADLWCWLRGKDPGQLLLQQRAFEAVLGTAFVLEDSTSSFMYREGRDLTGYVDGTENPEGTAAREAAFTAGRGEGLDCGSFVAVQRWVHDLQHFGSLSPQDQDHSIGRRISDNEEIDEAPETAHVKRTAQEDFDPPAFLLRRSMPWSDPRGSGLVFVAFGESLSAFHRQMRRMVGTEDGIVDALFGFSHPVTGASFWCPPVKDDKLDLRAIGLPAFVL
jgi:putative iron-dependent peroxidase